MNSIFHLTERFNFEPGTSTPAKTYAIAGMMSLLLVSGCSSAKRYLAAQPVSVSSNSSAETEEDWGVVAQVRLLDDIYVRLENKGEKPVYVRWDESAYMTIDQRSLPVEQVGEAGSAKSYSVLAPNSFVEARLKPVGAQHPAIDPLLVPKKSRNRWWPLGADPMRIGSEIDDSHTLLGEEVGLFFVLERDGVKRNVMTKFRFVGEMGAS